ncbi:hypothetical protein GCM10027398_34050 [Azotobacter salinestris]
MPMGSCRRLKIWTIGIMSLGSALAKMPQAGRMLFVEQERSWIGLTARTVDFLKIMGLAVMVLFGSRISIGRRTR